MHDKNLLQINILGYKSCNRITNHQKAPFTIQFCSNVYDFDISLLKYDSPFIQLIFGNLALSRNFFWHFSLFVWLKSESWGTPL